jgi:exonuclease III
VHNTRSLPAHIENIRSDCNLLSADILIFTEARMRTSARRRNIRIPGFSHDYGKSSAIKDLDDVIVYQRDWSPDFYCTTISSKCHLEYTIKYDIFSIPGISDRLHLISVYRSSHPASINLFFAKLQEFTQLQQRLRLSPASPLLICGDFNIDLLRSDADSKRETSLLSSYDLFQHVPCHTTDFRSLLDHVWSNLPASNLEVSMQESFWSDHVPVLVALTL